MPAETILDIPLPQAFAGFGLQDASTAFARATDPDAPSASVIGWPGCRLSAAPIGGDLILARGPSGRWRPLIVAGTADGGGALAARNVSVIDPSRPEATRLFQLTGLGGLVAAEAMLVRARPEGAGEISPPPPRPTIRTGSRGPAVIHAQERLNKVHANRLAAGLSPIEDCPLTVDGIFGGRTRTATVSFQRIAFPDAPSEWDGIIGPKTWAALDEHARDRPPVPVPRPPVIPGIIPVVARPLDPSRWGPILTPLLSARAVMRSGNAMRSIVDGPETFRLMVMTSARQMVRATISICLAETISTISNWCAATRPRRSGRCSPRRTAGASRWRRCSGTSRS